MEFYQKLQKLRKENGMSQEELAGQLDVSRQAVSKWESGQGFPETEKILQISTLFKVSLDYLLKSEAPLGDEEGGAETGFYASREMVNGFLLYRRQGARRIAIGVALCILSIVFPMLFGKSIAGPVLLLFVVSIGVAMFVSLLFLPKRYDELLNQPLVFDPAFFKEFSARYADIRRRNGMQIICGILLCFFGVIALILFSAFTEAASYRASFSELYAVVLPIFVAGGVSLLILATSALNAAGIIAENDKHMQEVRDDKTYGWVYASIMPLASMIFLALGFLWKAWHPGWLVFPVAALLGAAIVSMMKNVGKRA